MNKKFSNDFIFGGATAAYQVEGATNIDGKGKCVWDDYYHRPNAKFNADIASDFYHLYEQDLDLGKSINLNGIRISISWSRIFPQNNGDINQKGVDFYHKLIDTCIAKGIEPLVTLHHFDSPKWIVDQGDFLNKKTIDNYLDFAHFCFKEFGTKVKKWATFNEANAYATMKYIDGKCPPCEIGNIAKALQAIYNTMVAHAKTVLLYKEMNLTGKIGIIHAMQFFYPTNPLNDKDVLAVLKARVLSYQAMLDLNYLGYYSQETWKIINFLFSLQNQSLNTNVLEKAILQKAIGKTDFLGINYYSSQWYEDYAGETEVFNNANGAKGTNKFLLKGVGKINTPNWVKTTDWDWPIYPQGLKDLILWISKNYPNYCEILITENGIGCKEKLDENNQVFDIDRINYLEDHLQVLLDLISESNIKIIGYYMWSWQDMFSWANGFSKRYGFFFVDFPTQKRYYKLSSFWFKEVIDKKSLDIDIDSIIKNYGGNMNQKKTEKQNILICSDSNNIHYKECLIAELNKIYQGSVNIIDFCKGKETNIVDTTISAVKLAEQNYQNFKLVIIDFFGSASFMTASKFKHCVVAQLEDEHSARMTRDHNNTNVICLGSYNLSIGLAINIVKKFIQSDYSGGRHQVRVNMLEKMLEQEEE